MPLIHKKDKKGIYFKYGPTGKKYYYNPDDVVNLYIAKYKARKQGKAIEISKRSKS